MVTLFGRGRRDSLYFLILYFIFFGGSGWDQGFRVGSVFYRHSFQAFHTRISEIIDKHALTSKLSRKEVTSLAKPWVTKVLRGQLRSNKNYIKIFWSGSPYYLTKYWHYRNHISFLLKRRKQNYYYDFFKSNNKNIKNIWTVIRQIITLKPKE